jgi:O-antigen ligase
MTAWAGRASGGRGLSVLRWLALAVAAGLALGIAVSLGPGGAAALTVALCAGVALTFRPPLVLALLAASMFFEQANIGGATVSRFIALVAIGLVVAEAARGRARVDLGVPLMIAIVYGLWALSSAFWTVSDARTQYLLGSLVVCGMYLVAFAALPRRTDDLYWAMMGIAIAALVSGIVSLSHFATSGVTRQEGLTGDPNFFAAYQVFAFPIVLALASQARQPWLRGVLFVTLIAVIGSIFTSLSRGGILSLALITLIVVVVPSRALFRSLPQKGLAAVIVAVGVAVALTFSYQAIATRIASLVQGQEATGSGRVNEWRAAMRSFQERPLTGVGFGAFPTVSNELVKRTPGADLHRFDLRPTGTHVHSVYLGSLAELGLIGLTLYLSLMLSSAVVLRRGARRAIARGDPLLGRLLNALVLALLGWAVASVFLSSETSRPVWIAAGIALAVPRLLPQRTTA